MSNLDFFKLLTEVIKNSWKFPKLVFGLLFWQGLASFFSPCVFSLVPAYVGYLGGRAAGAGGQPSRWLTFSHGVAFVLGFSVVFVLLGVAASFAGGITV